MLGRNTALSLNITSLPKALCNQSRIEIVCIGHLVTNFDWTVSSYLIIDFSYEKLVYLQDKQANKHKEETREINFQNPKKVPK